MRTYIWIAQVRVWVVACFEQFIWTMHFEINKNFRFRNSSHRFSIWKPHSTIMPAPAHHRSNVFFWTICISVATAYLLIRWQHAFYVHFASGTNLLLIFPQCECMHCGLPFQFNHWHTGDNCATNTTTPSCLPPTTRYYCPCQMKLIYSVDWFVQSLGLPSHLMFPISIHCSASEPFLYLMKISMQQKLLFKWIRMSNNRCQDLNSKEKPLKTKS